MSVLEMSEEEKKKILDQHRNATKDFFTKKEETKNGLKKPEKTPEKKEEKTK